MAHTGQSHNFQALANSILNQAAQESSPAMRSLLQAMVDELNRIGVEVFPPPEIASKITAVTVGAPVAPTGLTAEITRRNVILRWSAGSDDFTYYEVRKGTVWSTASHIIDTAERQVILDPLPIGDHTYLVRSFLVHGVYSDSVLSVTFTIPPIPAPAITSTTIDQNVLLYWTPPSSSFDIKEYIVEQDGVEVGTVAGTFIALVELVKDTYVFSVRAVDIAGNEGSEGIISVLVAGPPDFILRNDFQSDLSGTKVNARLQTYNNSLLLPIDLTETWADHFVNNSWATPQDQVDAGYPLYIQPGTITASYQETFDVGLIYPASVVSIAWNVSIITGSFTIGVSTRVSDDGISWSTPQVGQNVFFESLRFIEVTVNFTGADDKALLEFFNFRVFVNVKQSIDSGEVSAVASDPSGTFVTFNVDFKDVDSITVSAESTTGPLTALYDFNDIPNPTGFAVYVFNTAGARVSNLVSWKARGIV